MSLKHRSRTTGAIKLPFDYEPMRCAVGDRVLLTYDRNSGWWLMTTVCRATGLSSSVVLDPHNARLLAARLVDPPV